MKTKHILAAALAVGALVLSGCAAAEADPSDDGGGGEEKTLGIVALVATDALNAAVIEGATEAAEAEGWNVVVTDTQGSADKANSAMTAFSTTQKVDAILVSAFASSSIGAGLQSATAAGIPVVSWGGELIDGIVATTSAQKVGEDSVNAMLDDFGDTGEVLALTYHTGVLCLYRGIAFDAEMEGHPDIAVTANEVAIPGQVEDGTAFTAAWLASHPADGTPYAIWGAWDEPGLGAIAAINQAGRDDVKVYSINGAPGALQAVKDGTMTQIIWQDGFKEGQELFQAVLDSEAAGDEWEPVTIDVPGVLVDSSTIEQFLTDHPDALS
ncbi:sugar ABC transporter substrate-binding protein [Microbacterium sp.]|uniref:sugar ABC transporter substrate-binding protein n=1 Tax=Microbacterium sp. TaxID=51671 RepID=UPI003F9C5EFA